MANSTVESITTTACDHCGREIPTLNIDLHVVHCFRNLEKCTICGTMIPKKHAEEHYMDEHAPVTCSLCSQKVERNVLEAHKVEICAQRIVACKYCEFPLPAVDLSHHQDSCGNRTEVCLLCHVYVRRRDQLDHDIQHSVESTAASSSIYVDDILVFNKDVPTQYEHLALVLKECKRQGLLQLVSRVPRVPRCGKSGPIYQQNQETATKLSPIFRHNGSTEARRDPPGRRPPHSSHGRVWATIAITGVAVLIGSIFLQRRTNHQQDQ